jgi:hypothetical protein
MSGCNHRQCAICLRRACQGIGTVTTYGKIWACYSCVIKAVEWTFATAQKWGGEYPQKECGYARRGAEASQ